MADRLPALIMPTKCTLDALPIRSIDREQIYGMIGDDSITETRWIEWIDAWIIDSKWRAKDLWKVSKTIDTTVVVIDPFLKTKGWTRNHIVSISMETDSGIEWIASSMDRV
jgi:hypothetical protein